MTFLLGRQAILGQEPPIYFHSTTATCFPSLANAHAMYLAPSPLPKTTMSYSSGLDGLPFAPVKALVEPRSSIVFIEATPLPGRGTALSRKQSFQRAFSNTKCRYSRMG